MHSFPTMPILSHIGANLSEVMITLITISTVEMVFHTHFCSHRYCRLRAAFYHSSGALVARYKWYRSDDTCNMVPLIKSYVGSTNRNSVDLNKNLVSLRFWYRNIRVLVRFRLCTFNQRLHRFRNILRHFVCFFCTQIYRHSICW